jgi:hypothetical protein
VTAGTAGPEACTEADEQTHHQVCAPGRQNNSQCPLRGHA